MQIPVKFGIKFQIQILIHILILILLLSIEYKWGTTTGHVIRPRTTAIDPAKVANQGRTFPADGLADWR